MRLLHLVQEEAPAAFSLVDHNSQEVLALVAGIKSQPHGWAPTASRLARDKHKGTSMMANGVSVFSFVHIA